jgi:putative flippase GtrA
MTNRFSRIAPFLSVSAVGAGIDFVIVYTLVEAFGLAGWISFAISMLISASVTYGLHEHFTFKDPQKSALNKARWGRFVVWSFVIYVVRVIIFSILARFSVGTVAALIIAICATAVLNYIVSQAAIFKRA